MASYLRSIFWRRDSTKSDTRDTRTSSSTRSGKSHTRSRSESPTTTSSPTKSKHFKYLYADPGQVPPAPIQTTRERSTSFTAARANAPSPLRYAFKSSASQSHNDRPYMPTHHTSHSLDTANSKVPLYRTSSQKERPMLGQNPTFNSSHSFGSVRSSNQSLYSNHSPHRYASSRNSSSGSVATQSTSHEPRSVLKHSSHGAGDSMHSRHAHVSFQNPNRPSPVHMHPLLSYGRIQRAPISFDVNFPPSTKTVVDRHTHSPIPPCTLTQPATEPPTFGRFTLKCDKLPWQVVATTGGDHTQIGSIGRSSGKRFYIGSTSSGRTTGSRSSSSSCSPEAVTNLDVLHAIHTTLSARVTQAEWDSLGNGSRAQRKATRAYEKRCNDMGGGWGAGVRRVDFLGGKTKLVGVEIATEKVGSQPVAFGKLVFSRP